MRKVFLLIPSVLSIFTCSIIAGDIVKVSPLKKAGRTFSDPTDKFRSVQTGDWGATSTWESSPDGTTWSAATLTPTSSADTISIRNGNVVTVSSDQNMDQVVILSGGTLYHAAGILTIIGFAAGDDMVVDGGGIFTLASNGNEPQFTGSATVFINPNAILRVSASGLTGAGAGVNASNFVYSNASVLELNTGFSTDNVTYFPNVNATTIPIFRTTNNLVIGSNNQTTFNGVFEASGGTITFLNSGTKTFRNGIIGVSNVNGSTSGKFIINGTTASLGGTGTLTLPATGMDIGNNTTVTMTSNKSVTGNIALLTNALVMLDTYNLTMTGSISGGSATSHIVTNGSGKLVVNNVQAFPSFSIFPIGGNTTTYNPVAIANADGLNFGARVEIGINPTIRFPIAAVNRTWVVNASGTPVGTVYVNFIYSTGHGNASFNYNTTVEQGFYTSVWNVINTGLVQAGGPPTYQVATTINIFQANTDAPMVLGNIPAILEPNNSVFLQAQKQIGKIMLNWSAASLSNAERFIAERSPDGRAYSTIAELPSSGVSFTDMQPLPGLNYYRIKMIEKDGRISYSNIAVVLNEAKGIALIHISPNPVVSGNFKLNVSAAQKTLMEVVITDMQGRLLQKRTINIIAGSNLIPIYVAKLAAGTYQLYGNSADGRSNILRFVKQ